MKRYLLALALLVPAALYAQQEGPAPTQALISFESKAPAVPTASDIVVKVNNRATTLLNIAPVPPSGAEIALLIDDGLRSSLGRELDNLRSFIQGLPQGTSIFVGYMQNGRVVPGYNGESGFTTDLATAASAIRMAQGFPGASASPYFCLSDFVKNWPGPAENAVAPVGPRPAHKARFVIMITNGVDPYNGSTSIMNQDSPYVASAITDAQRAGVPVYSIYFSDAGFRRGRGTVSGQNYLSQVAEATGGVSYYMGSGNPVSLEPFLKQFKTDVGETYVATFPAPAGKDMARLKVSTSLPKTKVRAPSEVRAGTVLFSQQ